MPTTNAATMPALSLGLERGADEAGHACAKGRERVHILRFQQHRRRVGAHVASGAQAVMEQVGFVVKTRSRGSGSSVLV